ncbi:MAG: VWA domain-containing protein [Chromatiaceae bacterium]|nr:MAG: VWA domain-containing protein [Chromatiaceae bacterium]
MLNEFHFLHPAWLLALAPLLALLWWRDRQAGAGSPWRQVIAAHLLAVLLEHGDRARRLPLLLAAAGALLAVLALADPVWERLPVPALRSDAARVLVLDLSQSMLAADLGPDRLTHARYKLADILGRDPDGQVGLVVVAGAAFTVAPLTDDAATLLALLPALTPDIMPVQGSRIDLGLRQALDLLAQAGARQGEVVLLADEAGDARALDAARALRAAGHRLAVIGVGTPAGAPVPGVRRADGPVVLGLDDQALTALARAGGGAYSRLRADAGDLDAVLGRPGSQAARPSTHPLLAERWRSRGPWLTLALLPVAALAFRRGWLTMLLLAPLAGLLLPTPALALGWDDLWQRREQQAASALAAGDYRRAEALATAPAQRGSARYRLGDYAGAAAAFAAGDAAVDHYNRGNALARAGDLSAALDAYAAALARDPDLDDARHNQRLLQDLLRRQQEQQEQQEQQGQPGEQGEQDQQGDQGLPGSGVDRQQSAAGASAGSPGSEPGSELAPEPTAPPGSAAEPRHGDTPAPARQSPAAAGTDTRAAAEQAAAAQREAAAAAAGETGADSGEEIGEEIGADAGGDADQRVTGAAGRSLDTETREARQAADQWLRRIPDDPGALLRRKFLYQYRDRVDARDEVGAGNPW